MDEEQTIQETRNAAEDIHDVMVNALSLQPLLDSFLKVKVEKPKDWYMRSHSIPLGTYEPWSNYGENPKDTMTDKDWYWYDFDEEAPFNIFVGAKPGRYKTVLLKKIVKYFEAHRYDICVASGKSGGDWSLARKLGTGFRLYKEEFPSTLPMVSLLPSFVANQNQGVYSLNEKIVKKYDEIFTLDIKSVQTADNWSEVLGLGAAGANLILDKSKKANSIEDLKKAAAKEMNPMTRNSLLNRLGYLQNIEMFNTARRNFLNIPGYWNKKQIPCVDFWQKDVKCQCLVVSKIMEQELNYSINNTKTNKLNVWDDSNLYLGRDTFSAKVDLNTIIHGRSEQFNGIRAAQNLDLFEPAIIRDCNDLFIGQLDDYSSLSYLGSDIMDILKALDYNDDDKVVKDVQYLHIPDNKSKARRFYVCGGVCGHTF